MMAIEEAEKGPQIAPSMKHAPFSTPVLAAVLFHRPRLYHCCLRSYLAAEDMARELLVLVLVLVLVLFV